MFFKIANLKVLQIEIVHMQHFLMVSVLIGILLKLLWTCQFRILFLSGLKNLGY